MMRAPIETLKNERMAWSWAVVIGLFLVFAGHAPVLPVIAGCLLAVTMSALRSISKNRPGRVLTRGGR